MKVAIRPWPWWAVVCLMSAAAGAAPSKPPDPAGAISEGRLITERGGAKIDVPLERTDVAITVDGFLAEATVTQRFRNPYPTKIEAVYLFPLPTGAAVSAMRIASGGRVIEGDILERRAATQIYEAARRNRQIAALLAQERPNLFTQSVANLEPGAVIEVALHYVQRLPYDAGGYELVFPMVAGPRYLPAAAKAKTDPAAVQPAVLPAGVRSSHDIRLVVELDAGVPIEDIASSSHQISVARAAGSRSRAHVEIAASDAIPNKDFVLRYRVAGVEPAFGALGHRGAPASDGSFVFVAQPPAAALATQITPREIVFALDTSSSMRGAPLAQAKRLIRAVLAGLRPDDTFQIVRFDDRASALGAAPIANRPRNVELTLAWLDGLEAGGTTEMTTGIAAALAVPHDPLRLRIVAFLTDGFVGNEDEVIRLVGERAGDARLFAFGVGSAVNRYLLEEVAAAGRGAAQFVRPDEPTDAVVAAFERRIAAPVLTDVAIDWGGLAVRDVTPRALPDLFVGQPLAVSGRYTRGGRAVVTVRGRQAGRAVQFAVPVELPEHSDAHPAIATVWARERIAELSRRLIRGPDPAVERQIVELSIASRVLTQLTAFVAVDRSRTTAGGAPRRVAVPVEIPDAVATIEAGAIAAGGSAVGYGGVMVDRLQTEVPIVRIAAPSVQGSLDKTIIRRYMRRHLAKVVYCYEQRLQTRPALAGTLTAHFVISSEGRVVTATADGIADPALQSCVVDAIRAIEFPASIHGDPVEVNYPFELRPSEATP